MSVVTTQPEMLTSVPSTSNARLRAGGSHGHPGDGAGMDGGRRVERRRNGRSGDSPMDVLTRLPAVVVLERLAVPTAFAEMVGYEQDGLAGLAFPEIFQTVPAAGWRARLMRVKS